MYQYGYRLLIEKICALILTIVIAVLFHAWLEIILFCSAFIPIRTFAGGKKAADPGSRDQGVLPGAFGKGIYQQDRAERKDIQRQFLYLF